MDREQLDSLRRQVEEDYRLDIAAIERLQRRFQSAPSSIPNSAPVNSAPLNAYPPSNEWSKFDSRNEAPSPQPPPAAPAERKSDELEGSLRTMFSTGFSGRK